MLPTLKNNSFFENNDVVDNLRSKSVQAGKWAIIGQIASFVINFLITIILARLLLPKDYGLLAMVMVITNFAMIFKDIGLSTATIQKKCITPEQVSSLFWINLAVSIVVALILVATAPLIASFYNEHKLIPITITMAFSFPLSGLIIQHHALLCRKMMFKQVAIIQNISLILSAIFAITAAFNNLEYWSLVIFKLFQPLFLVPLTFFCCNWIPSAPIINTETIKMLKFGGNITGFNFVNYFSRNFDKLLIGKFASVVELGFYSKAYQLLMIPISQIRVPLQKVATPALSMLQNDKEQYSNYYYHFLYLIALTTMPAMVYLGIYSRDIVFLVLGENWLEMCSLLTLFSIAAFIQPVASTRGVVMISLGQSNRLLKWGIFNSTATIFSFLIGIKWGAQGVVAAYCILQYLILLPSLNYCYANSPITIPRFFRAISGPAISSLLMGSVLLLIQNSLEDLTVIMRVCISTVTAFSLYTLIQIIVPHWKADLTKILKFVRNEN